MINWTYRICIISILLCLIACTSTTNRINKEIERLNKQFPKMLTEEIRIDSIRFEEGTNTLKYYHTLLDVSIFMNLNRNNTQINMARAIRKTASLSYFREQKITFKYIYLNESKTELLKIAIPYTIYNRDNLSY